MEGTSQGAAPAAALAAVLKHSSALPESAKVQGYDFNRGVDYQELLEAFGTTGFQATNFGRAVQQVNAMVRRRAAPKRDGRAGPRHADPRVSGWGGGVLVNWRSGIGGSVGVKRRPL